METFIVLGGDNNGPTFDTIVEYDVQNDVAQTLTVTMPKPLVFHSCVTDQANGLIYCFGGSNNNIVNDEIFQFDPSTQSITTIPTTFPDHGRQDLSCVYDQSTSWIFCYGGQNLGVTKQDIFGFDPSTLGMIRLKSEFDMPVRESSCTSIQGTTYCVGSSYGSNPNIYAHQPSVLHWESLRG